MSLLRSRRAFGVLVLVLLIPSLAACQSAPTAASEATTIRMAKQPGLAYLPLIVMREQKLIEKRAPGITIDWHELTSTPAIRDAMIAGQIDVGAGGVPPFIEAFDKGVKWKIAAGMVNMPSYLVVNRPDITSLKDIGSGQRIAMPAIGSPQHVTLQMAAEKELGDPHALDDRLVAMAHPDAQAALLSKKEIVGHFGSPPFQYDELAQGGSDFHVLVDSYKVLGGPVTFAVVWAMDDWASKNPKLFQAVFDAQAEATAFIHNDPAGAARVYVEGEKAKQTPEEILRQMQGDGVEYTTTPLAMMKYAEFMRRIGTIKNVPGSWKDYTFPTVHTLPGS